MVLEYLFPEGWLKKKKLYAFLIGAGFSIVAIYGAWMLFPSDPALVAVAFTALLIFPQLYKLFGRQVDIERKKKKVSLKGIYIDNKDIVLTYLFLVLGIFLVYTFAAMILPQMQVNSLFREQMEMRGASAPGDIKFTFNLFLNFLTNNWWVLLAVFILALIAGDGAIFIITWNASMWGTIFGATARYAAAYQEANALFYLLLILITVLPHAFLEMMSYILAAISGSVISKKLIRKSRKRNMIVKYLAYCFLFVALYTIYKFLTKSGVSTSGASFPIVDWTRDLLMATGLFASQKIVYQAVSFIILVIGMIIILLVLWFLTKTFPDLKNKQVYISNFWLLIIAIGFLFIGALVEAIVLGYTDIYIEMIRSSVYYVQSVL